MIIIDLGVQISYNLKFIIMTFFINVLGEMVIGQLPELSVSRVSKDFSTCSLEGLGIKPFTLGFRDVLH